MEEIQLVPPPALEHKSRSGRISYPASHYYRIAKNDLERVYRYRRDKINIIFVIRPYYCQVIGKKSLFNRSGIYTYIFGTSRKRAIEAMFNGLEDSDNPYWVIESGTKGSWEDQIKSMAYLEKLVDQGKTLNKYQLEQYERVKKYAPAD